MKVFLLLVLVSFQAVASPFLGVWDVNFQTECTGDWYHAGRLEVLEDGTCNDRGLECTWIDNNGEFHMLWTLHTVYVNKAQMDGDNFLGTVDDGSNKWCWQGTRPVSKVRASQNDQQLFPPFI